MLDDSVKNVIRFAIHRHVTSEGKENTIMEIKDGQKVVIANVLYVPSMTSN